MAPASAAFQQSSAVSANAEATSAAGSGQVAVASQSPPKSVALSTRVRAERQNVSPGDLGYFKYLD